MYRNSLDAFNTFQQESDHFDHIITDMTMADTTGAYWPGKF